MSGDQAAWRDLVARLELPQYVDPATAPWPARENLGGAQAGQGGQVGPGGGAAATTAADQGSLIAETDRPEPPGGTSSGNVSGTDHSRVIRPASFNPFLADPAGPASPAAGADSDHQHYGGDADYPDSARADRPGYGDDFDDEDTGDRYIPPPAPPLPKLDPMTRGAWTGLFGGPGYLFTATLLNWQVPGWAELAAIIAFVAGFAVLVSRLGDGPSRGDGPDQGAVV